MSNTLIKRSDGTYKHVLCMTWFDKSTLQLASVSRCIEDTRWFREQCQMHIFHFENMLYWIYIYVQSSVQTQTMECIQKWSCYIAYRILFVCRAYIYISSLYVHKPESLLNSLNVSGTFACFHVSMTGCFDFLTMYKHESSLCYYYL